MIYKDFELMIQTKSSQGFPVLAKGPAGEVTGSLSLSEEDQKLNGQLDDMGFAEDNAEPIKSVGGILFQKLFNREVQSLYDRSLARLGREEGLRIRLMITPPELVWYHWEFLYDARQETFLALSDKTPVVRDIPLIVPREPLPVPFPLRILMMISSPSDLEPLNVEKEQELIEGELRDLMENGKVQIKLLNGKENAHIRGLQNALREQAYDIFHFIGHGKFDDESGKGYLAFENEESGGVDFRSVEDLRVLFDSTTIRLAILNSCETGVASERTPLTGVAHALLRIGIPAIIAMQFSIPDATAQVFSRAFYAALVDNCPVDTALSEARKAIYFEQGGGRIDWGIPVLFMRSPDGIIWKVQEEGGEMNRTKKEPNNQVGDKTEKARDEEISKDKPGGDTITGIVSNVSGGQVAIGENIQQTQTTVSSRESFEPFKDEEFLQKLRELKALLTELDLDPDIKEDIEDNLSNIRQEVKKAKKENKEPDRDRLAQHLKKTNSILDTLGKAGEIGKKLLPALRALARLIGENIL
jgi:hypothetical protein